MGAPTWPPTPEEALLQTRKEYGETQSEFLSPEEFEQAWLERLLKTPDFHRKSEGINLESSREMLQYWAILKGYSARPIIHTEGHAAQTLTGLYLPTILPMRYKKNAISAWQMMIIIQEKMFGLGIVRNSPLIQEMYNDWPLRQHILHLILVSCQEELRPYWDTNTEKEWLSRLFIGNTEIRPQDLEPPMLSYIWSPFTGERIQNSTYSHAHEQVSQALPSLQLGVIQSSAIDCLREARAQKWGIPPSPVVAGGIRPTWLSDALKVDIKARDAWKAGPRPLRLLNRILKRTGKQKALEPNYEDSEKPKASNGENTIPEWNNTHSIWVPDRIQYTEHLAKSTDEKLFEQIIHAHNSEATRLKQKLESLVNIQNRRFQSPMGQEIDIDAFLRSIIDIKSHQNEPESLFIEHTKDTEWPSVHLLIDETGSSHYRFLQAQQIALALLAYSTQRLPLPWEACTFSGSGEGSIQFKWLKKMHESPSAVSPRLGDMKSKGGSRLGGVLRWANRRITNKKAVVIWFSDLVPEDGASYQGNYANSDLWAAIQELRAKNHVLHVFDFSGRIGQDAAENLVGPGHYSQIEQMEQFPTMFSHFMSKYLD